MWTHPATRANVERLRDDFGYRIVEPESGPLRPASGMGRLAALADHRRRGGRRPSATGRFGSPRRRPPAGRSPSAATTWTVGTSSSPPAAPPRRSTPCATSATARPGKMGVAIAAGRAGRGARVTLIAGRSTSRRPPAVASSRAESTAADARRRPGARVLARTRRRARHGRRRCRLPADHAATTKLARDARPDARAGADRGHPGRGSARGLGRRRPHARSSSASRPRPGRSSAPPTSRAARVPTCWWPTTSPRRVRGSAPTRTGSRSSAPTDRATTCRCCRRTGGGSAAGSGRATVGRTRGAGAD